MAPRTASDRAATMALEKAAHAQAYERARHRPVAPLSIRNDAHAVEVIPDGDCVRIRCIRFARPLLENAYHAAHYRVQAKLRDDWVTAYRLMGAVLPGMDWVTVTAIPHVRDGRSQDLGACFPAVKASLDGIVRAGLLVDDSPLYVRELRFRPVVMRSPLGDALELRLNAFRCGPDGLDRVA